jgi:hypothetical protein
MHFLLLHHKNAAWAPYVKAYSQLGKLETSGLATIAVESMPQQNAHKSFAELPAPLRRLLFYAKPDLIVCLDDGQRPLRPIFALDVTDHTPATDHWMQRFPNLVGCAVEGIPGAFVMPTALPNRPKFRGVVDPTFFFAYDRVIEIHQTPIYIAQWPSSDGKTCDLDAKFTSLPDSSGADMRATFAFLDVVIDAAIHGQNLKDLMRSRMIIDLRNRLRSVGYQTLPTPARFERLKAVDPTGGPIDGRALATWLRSRSIALPSLPPRLDTRDRYLVYTPQVVPRGKSPAQLRTALLDRIQKHNGDPYMQQPLAFDYLFCRLGATPEERDVSLVLDYSVLTFSDFAAWVSDTWQRSPLQHQNYGAIRRSMPVYSLHLREGLGQVMKSFVRLTAFAADLIVFSDGVLVA